MQVIRGYSDQEIIAALKTGTEMDTAIGYIYKNYYSSLESYVLKNNGSKDDAADIIQETLVAFIEIIQQDKFRGEASVKSFLFSIVKNLWLSELRKRNNADNRNRIFEKAKDTDEQAMVQHLIKLEYQKTIVDLLEKLGEKCKRLLLLVYYEDLSMKEIAVKMPEYENEQVLRNKKYKCMKSLEQMIFENEHLKTQFKNALKYAG